MPGLADLDLDRVGLWPLRALWAALPLTAGAALADALAERSAAVRLLAAVLAWAGWAGVLVATLVPHPLGLTVLRLAVPTAVVVAGWSAVAAGAPATGALAVTGVLALAAVALLPSTADHFVDGASYGPERRFALRVPAPLLAGPLPLAWLAAVAGVLTGPFLLAARQWVGGGVAIVAGLPLAALAARAVHGLSQRFLVFVPAGFVLHDRAVLLEPVLLPRSRVAGIGPAEVHTTATDLTLRAPGLVLEVRLSEPVTATRRRGRRAGEQITLERFLICPTRPGAVLREARARRLPVG